MLQIKLFKLIVNIGTPIQSNKAIKPILSKATSAVIPKINNIIEATNIETIVKAPRPIVGQNFCDIRQADFSKNLGASHIINSHIMSNPLGYEKIDLLKIDIKQKKKRNSFPRTIKKIYNIC